MGAPALVMLAAQTVQAGLQLSGANAMGKAQAEGINNNLRESYRAGQEQQREAAVQAAEQTTDRSRAAQRQLSMARVIAAEGGGSLAARAINIDAGAAEDMSRIDAGRKNIDATVRGNMAAGRTAAASQLDEINTQFKANQIQFLGSVGSAAAQAGASAYGKAVDKTIASKYVKDYQVKADYSLRPK